MCRRLRLSIRITLHLGLSTLDCYLVPMVDRPPIPEVTIWTDARRAVQVGQLLELMQGAVRPAGLGGPHHAKIDDLSRQLDRPVGDDLRKLLVERPAPFVLLATMDGVTREDLVTALAQDSVVLTVEPVAASFDELPLPRARASSSAEAGASAAALSWASRLIPIPGFTRSPGWTSAAEPLEVLGAIRLIGVTSFGSANECSLFSRLHDAFRVIHTLAAMPESIDAMLAGPSVQAQENPRQITGHLAAFARLPGGATAVLQVSDRTGPNDRQLTIVGDQSRIRAGDLDYDLIDHEGRPLDHRQSAEATGGFTQLIAWQWKRVLQRPSVTPAQAPPPDDAQILACCLACLLSARTGQPESPGKIADATDRMKSHLQTLHPILTLSPSNLN